MTRRLLLSYLSITAFVLLALEVPLGVTFARAERDRLVTAVERDATVLATSAEEALEADNTGRLQPLATQYQRRTGGRVVLVDRLGITVGDSEPPSPGRRDLSTRPEIAAALHGRRAVGSRSSATLGSAFLYVAVPVASQGTVLGAVRITYPTAAVDARVRRLSLALAGVALVVLAAVALIGSWLARSVTRPLRGLERATAALANGDLEARAPAGAGPPELRRLATAFNDMAARLGRLVGAQRAFVADASHQLRTPLTALRLRLENIEPSISAGTADLDAAIADRRSTWAPLAAEQDVELLVPASSGAPERVWALPGALEQVLDNLLANALRAAPAGSRVRIATRRAGEWVELHVIDQGPGMTAEQRQRAFDRFWRAAPLDEEGTGLGLAIVRQLADAGGGAAELSPAQGGGLDAVVLLRPADHARGSGHRQGVPAWVASGAAWRERR